MSLSKPLSHPKPTNLRHHPIQPPLLSPDDALIVLVNQANNLRENTEVILNNFFPHIREDVSSQSKVVMVQLSANVANGIASK